MGIKWLPPAAGALWWALGGAQPTHELVFVIYPAGDAKSSAHLCTGSLSRGQPDRGHAQDPPFLL
jgi:hypothetical protein